MQNPNQKPLDLSPTEDGSIPAFLRREVCNSEKEVLPMKTDEEADASELPGEAPAKAPKKATPRKPAVKAKGNGKGNGATPHKASAKAAAKASAKPVKGKAKRAAPVRDPAKLDVYGFRKGTIKSKAAAMYAKGKGCTLGDVKEALGSVQFNLLTELKDNGFKVDTAEVKNAAGRVVTRYKIQPKA